jgi:DNA helicase-2/ATP-dependent DNA helicase PcrA
MDTVTNTQSAHVEERQRLQAVLSEIDNQLVNLRPRYYGDDFLEQVLDARREETRERLELLRKEPYFGRLDFQEHKETSPSALYIGKRGLDKADTSHDPYIIDWRAPVASLFYSFTGGEDNVQYEAPEGVIEGAVHLKRNLAIHAGELERVVDSYVRGGENLGVSDEFLLYRLGENKDNRLRDIVSSIQAEQDAIIRAPREAVLIIQGAAGSGKTTVALHRLAYLMYRYQGRMRAERMMIFAPNSMFLDYISNVLPELGVGNIQQATFSDWALELLKADELELESGAKEHEKWFGLDQASRGEDDQEPGRFKGSLVFRDWINRELEEYEARFLPDLDFTPWEGSCLTAGSVRVWFYEEYSHYPLAIRRDRIVARISRWLEMELGKLSPEHKKAAQKTAKQRLKAYEKKLPAALPKAVYRWLLESASRLQEIPQSIVRATRDGLKNNRIGQDDLAPLVWIHYKLRGMEGKPFDHVVIDEAQDASPFQIALFKERLPEASMTILGDLAQGIHDYRGIHRWSEFEDVFESGETHYHTLQQSYRSTMEIIEFANRFLSHTQTELPPAKAVFRSGEPVSLQQAADDRQRFDAIVAFIRESRDKQYRTAAVIGRTTEECRKVYEALMDAGEDVNWIGEGHAEYRGGVSVVPVYLSKGLEFDAVMLLDADERHYTASARDAKLMYVGCTRALHLLRVLHSTKPSPLL